MQYIKACINYDAISSYEGVKGQVELYLYDTNDDYDFGGDWESYQTEAEMLARVNYVNDNKFTWETLPSYYFPDEYLVKAKEQLKETV